MSLKAETFHAIRCDFPECGEIFDGDDYTYTLDPYENGWRAEECGWLVDSDSDLAYCPAHVVTIDCPESGMVDDDGERYCQWCEDHSTDTHLAAMEDTWANRLTVAMDRVVRTAHTRLDRLERELIGSRHGKLGDLGPYAQRTDSALSAIWQRTCPQWKPDITPQEFHDLRMRARR